MRQFSRDRAFKMDLRSVAAEDIGKITALINLDGKLISFTENRIVEIVPAENIDPENEQPQTRHSYQYIADIGSSNSYVARTIIQSKDILDSVILHKNIDKQAILDHVWKSTNLLLKCENSYYGIYKQVIDLMKKCDAIINEHKGKGSIPSLPQVANLEQSVESFLGNAKRFLEFTYALLNKFYGTPNYEANFSSYRNWMMENKPECTKIIDALEQDKEWVQFISWSRNALDINHSRDGFKVTIENFKLYKGNKFSSPSWQYDFTERNGKKQKEPSDITVDMNIYMHNMTTFFEELFLLCIQDNWLNDYNFEIYRKKDDEINKECPTAYFVSVAGKGEHENT